MAKPPGALERRADGDHARASVTAAAEMISQLNVEQVLGMRPRVFLELLREDGCPLEVLWAGKGRHVDLADFRRWLLQRTREKHPPETGARDDGLLCPAEQARLGIKPRTAAGDKPAPRTTAARR